MKPSGIRCDVAGRMARWQYRPKGVRSQGHAIRKIVREAPPATVVFSLTQSRIQSRGVYIGNRSQFESLPVEDYIDDRNMMSTPRLVFGMRSIFELSDGVLTAQQKGSRVSRLDCKGFERHLIVIHSTSYTTLPTREKENAMFKRHALARFQLCTAVIASARAVLPQSSACAAPTPTSSLPCLL